MRAGSSFFVLGVAKFSIFFWGALTDFWSKLDSTVAIDDCC